MGCFDGTCGVTQLPICLSDPVRMILLVSRPQYSEQGGGTNYCTNLATPQFLPIKGTYDDYGCIVPQEDWHTDLVVATFKRWLDSKNIQVENTDGKWKKGEDPRKFPTVCNWLKAIEQGYVKRLTRDDNKKHQPQEGDFQFMLVHEPIYQLAVNLGEERTKRYNKGYADTIAKNMVDLRRRRHIVSTLPPEEQQDELWANFVPEGLEIFDIFHTGVEEWDSHLHSYICEQMPNEDKVKNTLLAAAEFRYFFNFMSVTRRQFCQQAGWGCQTDSEDFLLHVTLFSAAEMLAKEQYRRAKE